MTTRILPGQELRVLLLSAAAMSVPVSALAQDDQAGLGLEEVIVTAQKRAENLQAVPLALTALSGETLERQHINNFHDLHTRVPSFVYDQYSPGQSRYYIRGIGNNLLSGAVDEDVGVFVDGVYLSRPAMADTEFPDLERVEILRGPQGTLFGRNVVGGAISFNTRKPSDTFLMRGEATYGNYDEISAKGYISGPLSEKVSASLAATSRQHEGYAFNTTTNNDVADAKFASGRGALRLTPSDTLDIQINADISRRRQSGQWWTFYKNVGTSATLPNADPWRGAHYPDDGFNDVDNHGYSGNINWDVGAATLTSITAYRRSVYDSKTNTQSPNLAPFGLTNAELAAALATGRYSQFLNGRIYHESARQFSQEVRLASSSAGPLKWVAGVYYFNNNVTYRTTTNNDFSFPALGINHASSTAGDDQYSEADAYAVFLNGSYDILENLTLQAGVRWSHEEKSSVIVAHGVPGNVLLQGARGGYLNNGVPLGIGVGYTTAISGEWEAWTPAVSINYQVVPDKFVYATVSKGFKSGGIPGANIDRALTLPLEPEYAWNYELGTKTEWLGRLRLNVSGFLVKYDDLQVRGFTTLPGAALPTRFVTNAGKTTSRGVEAELDFIVDDGINIYGTYTYTRARIDESSAAGCANPAVPTQCVIRVGDELTRTPHHKFSIGGTLRIPLSAGLAAIARADYSYTDSYFPLLPNNGTSCGNVPYCETVPAQKTLGAGLAFESDDGRWSIEFWGKNLTDQVHFAGLTAIPSYGVVGFLDPPRTYGVTARFRN